MQIALAGDYEDGMAVYDRRDYQTGHRLLLKAAEQGNVEAQFYLGLMYGHGERVTQDYK